MKNRFTTKHLTLIKSFSPIDTLEPHANLRIKSQFSLLGKGFRTIPLCSLWSLLSPFYYRCFCRVVREGKKKKGDEKKCNNSVSQRQRRSLFFVVNLLQNPSRRSFLTEAPQGDISHDALCSSRPDKQMALMQVFENEIRKKTGKKGKEGCF